MTAPIRPDRPSRTVATVLDDDTLDAIDMVSVTMGSASRSNTMRKLISFALAMILSEECVAEFVKHHTAADPAAETAPAPVWTGSINLRKPQA